MEVWKIIKGYENYYEVSNQGRIRSLDREIIYSDGRKCFIKGRIMKLNRVPKGYLQVNLTKNGKYKTFKVHYLVAINFVEGYFEGAEVDHINTIRDDNKAENLRWVTHKENNNNELTKEKRKETMKLEEIREKVGKGWFKPKPIYCVELNKIFNSITEASKELDIHNSCISKVCKGKQKQTNGYTFYYID